MVTVPVYEYWVVTFVSVRVAVDLKLELIVVIVVVIVLEKVEEVIVDSCGSVARPSVLKRDNGVNPAAKMNVSKMARRDTFNEATFGELLARERGRMRLDPEHRHE